MSTEREPVDNRFSRLLQFRGAPVLRGWDERVRDALVAGAQQQHIKDFTPTDAAHRFTTPELAQEWYDNPVKKPIVYSIGDKAVGGVIWFSHLDLQPDLSKYTFAIRMYNALRGRGLSGDFMEATHADFATQVGDDEATWLTTRKDDNDVAIELYSKHGYKVLREEGRRYIMLRDQHALRVQQQAAYDFMHTPDQV